MKQSIKENLKAMSGFGWEYEEAIRLLPSLQRALKNNKIYAKVDTVARSGMSRTITLGYIHKGGFINLNRTLFAKIYSDSGKMDLGRNGGGVRISGCGMDMLFEANYRLFRALCPKIAYQPYCRYISF